MFPESLDSMRVLAFEEQTRYLSKTSQPLRDIAEIMLNAGMGPEEVFRIRVENIDIQQKTIFNPFGKTQAARRTIPVTDDLLALLRRRMKRSRELDRPFLFPSRHNVQKPIGSVKKAHRSAATRAKIKGHFRLYDLRHTFATQTVASGADLPTLSSLLGHASILMTMRYVHPAADQKCGAIEKYEKFRAEGIINATIREQSNRIPTEITTLGRVN